MFYVGRLARAYDHGSKVFIFMVTGKILEMNPASVFCMCTVQLLYDGRDRIIANIAGLKIAHCPDSVSENIED
jgi:predicted nucleic acid-binding Zn finger protein